MAYNWGVSREIPVINDKAKIADHPICIVTGTNKMIGAAIKAILTENPGHVACSYTKCLQIVPSQCPVVIINSRLYHESCYVKWYSDLNAKALRTVKRRPRR